MKTIREASILRKKVCYLVSDSASRLYSFIIAERDEYPQDTTFNKSTLQRMRREHEFLLANFYRECDHALAIFLHSFPDVKEPIDVVLVTRDSGVRIDISRKGITIQVPISELLDVGGLGGEISRLLISNTSQLQSATGHVLSYTKQHFNDFEKLESRQSSTVKRDIRFHELVRRIMNEIAAKRTMQDMNSPVLPAEADFNHKACLAMLQQMPSREENMLFSERYFAMCTVCFAPFYSRHFYGKAAEPYRKYDDAWLKAVQAGQGQVSRMALKAFPEEDSFKIDALSAKLTADLLNFYRDFLQITESHIKKIPLSHKGLQLTAWCQDDLTLRAVDSFVRRFYYKLDYWQSVDEILCRRSADTCASCGTPHLPEQKFCHLCGSPLRTD